ncbi:MAG: hypothetical protein GY787_24900 [Alteromonadales bacterium]|nr:hypothetical protein [Alteromonadales bacterium]
MSFKLVNPPEIDAVNWMTLIVEGNCNICGGEYLALEPISTVKATVVCENCEAGIAVVERREDGEEF